LYLVKNQDGDDLSRKDDFYPYRERASTKEVKIMLQRRNDSIAFPEYSRFRLLKKAIQRCMGGKTVFSIIDRLARNVRKIWNAFFQGARNMKKMRVFELAKDLAVDIRKI
jgi:hypothetical protein